jgi:class 3 adenylate cyclase/tetratricopeptide (TPR) repeat protein
VEAERRQVTVLFADMLGFTSFSERSGEEQAFALMRSLWKLMAEAVREHGGVVQDFTGDGIMAVFGVPVALEDEPLRASRAALSILQCLKASGPDLEAKHGVRPQMRIGLNTGPAVVGKIDDRADGGDAVLGDTVNFAARLQSIAEPNSVFISEATHRLVQGLVDTSFVGKQTIKGKSEPQNVYRLNAVRRGAARFEVAVSRGLSAFVGREHELEVLERGLRKGSSELCVIDLAAEPGMGKSRLLHEFRQRIGKDRAFILSGSCSPDGGQTPFLPFIEVVHGSFRVGAGDAEKDIAQKLEMGLTTLGLRSDRNVGLLLHLLGLQVPDDALAGLDGLLIGLRTRELLVQLLEARCRLSPVVMVIEDLHWIDSVSEELLGKIIDSEAKLRLLLLTTRRPEYAPPWLARTTITKLPVEPLPIGDIRHLVQARLGVEALPETLAWQVMEKAEGNPLFAEEIITFLTERGILRAVAGKLDFDASAVAGALPPSVQGVLTARVDRLAPKDRALLQAASVIGRQFDPALLAGAVGEPDVNDQLAAMQALDLVLRNNKSDRYEFKHALVRDALYQSLLTEARTALHFKIADEIERRSGNRLAEMAEVLANHYSQTARAEKTFIYLSMAGDKSLSVYSLEEAGSHLTNALALLEKNPACASDDQVADFLVSLLRLLYMRGEAKVTFNVVERHLARIDRLSDDRRAVLIRHYYVLALVFSTRYRDAAAVQRQCSEMADRLGDNRSRAYSFAGEILLSTLSAPKKLADFKILRTSAIEAAYDTADAYIQNQIRWAIGWEEIQRGLVMQARNSARELMQAGRLLNDPRSTGFGLGLLTWIALLADSYAEALDYSEQSLGVAVTPLDYAVASGAKGCALVLLRRTKEGAVLLEDVYRRCVDDGYSYMFTGMDPIVGVCRVLQGKIAEGIDFIERAALRRNSEGNRVADWYSLILSEIYLQIIARGEKLPLSALLKNLPVLLKITIFAPARIRESTRRVLDNPHFHPEGHHVGHAQLILGLLYKAKKKHELAFKHLTEAKRILSQFGQTPIVARAEAALAEMANWT